MKNSLRSRLWLAALTLIIPSLALSAQEKGKVYQIVNDQYKAAMTSNGPRGAITGSTPDEKNFDQLWQVETSGSRDQNVSFRNLSTGLYLKSSTWQSQTWGLAEEIDSLSAYRITSVGNTGTVTLRSLQLQQYARGFAHCDQSWNVVCWDASAATSQWLLKEVKVSDEEIANAGNMLSNINTVMANTDKYAEVLGRIFADKACTRLNGTPSQADLDALSPDLRAMVAKIQSGNWEETNRNNASIKWADNYARKFRVQNYEVYSRGSELTGFTGIQAYTNMNNPTGIVANAYDVLYIMVDEAPKDGATLYFGLAPGLGMYNNWQTEYPLHDGLNVVPVYTNGAAGYIYYTADTYSNNERKHKLSEFPPIKIHIEGGIINSFYNSIGDALYKADTRADFNYYRDRAQHPMYDIVGKYTILHFFFDRTETNVGNGDYCNGVKQLLGPDSNLDISEAIWKWDELGITERLIMGLMSDHDIDSIAAARGAADQWGRDHQWYAPLAGDDIAPNDFSEYFNNRHMGITMQGNLYMNATTWRTAYNGNTMSSILDLFNGGSIWGPAHEYGHMNQVPMKLAGTTEISNNVFSNVGVFTHTDRTSRSNYISDQVNVFNNNQTFLENGIWGCTRMFLQLWLYYHAAGHNKAFYPRLYELLRRQPLQKPYELDPRYDSLHFAHMASIAAQEDLTEFFESWGFFVPVPDYHIGAYSNFNMNLTQAQADEMRKKIADLNLPKNTSIMFIDDRPGETIKNSWADYMAIEAAGNLGGWRDFKDGCNVTKPYTYILSGNNVMMEGGQGGVGFKVLGENGELLGFSNSYNFPVNAATAAALMSGKAKVMAVAASGEYTPAPSTLESASTERRAELLADLVKTVDIIVKDIDDEKRVVGKYSPDHCGTLRDLCNEAKKALEENAADRYPALYTSLSQEYYTVSDDPHKTIPFISGTNVYHLTLRGYPNQNPMALTAGSRKPESTTDINLDNEDQHWVFEPAGEPNVYFIKSVSKGTYITEVVRGNSGSVKLGRTPTPFLVGFHNDGLTYVSLQQNSDPTLSLNWNTGTKIIGWDAANYNSQWILTIIDADPVGSMTNELDELISDTEGLIAQAGTVVSEPRLIPIDQQASDDHYFSNAKCKSTQWGDQFTSFLVANDTTTSTFFHSDYSGADSDDGLDHYIGIDLGTNEDGSDQTVSSFHVGYQTRGSGNLVAPTDITIQGSADGKNWVDLVRVSRGLPTANDDSYLSDIIDTPTPMRWIRMMVHDNSTGQQAGGHKYFIVSEFHLYNAYFSASPSKAYPDLDPEILKEVYQAVSRAKAVKESADDFGSLEKAKFDLRDARNVLAAAMGKPLGIDNVADDEEAAASAAREGIYDLSGRRLRSAALPGIYIINGVKTIVR